MSSPVKVNLLVEFEVESIDGGAVGGEAELRRAVRDAVARCPLAFARRDGLASKLAFDGDNPFQIAYRVTIGGVSHE